MKRRSLALSLVALALAISACTSSADPVVKFNPTVEADETCSQILNNTFRTAAAYPNGESNGQTVFTPFLISFLLDGRVIWNYENGASYIGTFSCSNGEIRATFDEGSIQEATGVFIPASKTIEFEGLEYLIVEEL